MAMFCVRLKQVVCWSRGVVPPPLSPGCFPDVYDGDEGGDDCEDEEEVEDDDSDFFGQFVVGPVGFDPTNIVGSIRVPRYDQQKSSTREGLATPAYY